ncbi:Uncharacterised protein [Chlamydia trachomatis]|nr:Uncharacterised protein [Chlamydia trachomatis]
MYDENNNSTGSPQLSENYKINFINLLINRNGTTKKRKEMKQSLFVSSNDGRE